MAGYLALKSLSLRDRRWTRPPLLIAWARKPSSFGSYRQSPMGQFSVRSKSMGSMNWALISRSGIQEPVCRNRRVSSWTSCRGLRRILSSLVTRRRPPDCEGPKRQYVDDALRRYAAAAFRRANGFTVLAAPVAPTRASRAVSRWARAGEQV